MINGGSNNSGSALSLILTFIIKSIYGTYRIRYSHVLASPAKRPNYAGVTFSANNPAIDVLIALEVQKRRRKVLSSFSASLQSSTERCCTMIRKCKLE